MGFGFVYVLANSSMPGLYKIGCTERSPSKRAEELSRATGVATPFDVVCYAEFENCNLEERRLHQVFDKYRVNRSREFFKGHLEEIVEELECSEDSLSYCNVQVEYYIYVESHPRKHGVKRPFLEFENA